MKRVADCSGRGAAPTAHGTIDAGWSRRWASSAVPVVDGQGLVWEPDTLIACGGRLGTDSSGVFRRVGVPSYAVPIPVPGTWLVTFGVEPGAKALALTATGLSGVVRQNADVSTMRRVTMTVPEASGDMRVDLLPTAGPTVITSVTITLTQPLKLVFSDDFDGTRLDAAKWRAETGANGWGNRELQDYTSNPANVRVAAGRLAITARREPTFTSARLDSRFSATYGHIEARIRTPAGGGLLPAFWLLGADSGQVPWPGCGEIDVMESLGQSEPSTVHASLHGPDVSGRPWEHTTSIVTGQRLADGFHTYALDWWPNSLQMSVDGTAYASFTPEDLAPQQQWPFDKPYYLLLNLAVGGNWPGTPSPSLHFPQTMQVDYVRWWQ